MVGSIWMRSTEPWPNFSSLSKLRQLLVQMDFEPSLPTSLQDLTMLGHFRTAEDPEQWKQCSLPNLRAFAAEPYKQSMNRYLPDPETAPDTKLHCLSFARCIEEYFRPFIRQSCLTWYFSELTSLKIQDCDIDDETLEHVAAYCPRLTILNIRENPKVTGVGVKALVLKPGDKLQTLDLTHCTNVSMDAVEWARTKGLDVTYRHLDVGSGKRLRLA